MENPTVAEQVIGHLQTFHIEWERLEDRYLVRHVGHHLLRVVKKLQNIPEEVVSNSQYPMVVLFANSLFLHGMVNAVSRDPFIWAQECESQMSRRLPNFEKLMAALGIEGDDRAVVAAGIYLSSPHRIW